MTSQEPDYMRGKSWPGGGGEAELGALCVGGSESFLKIFFRFNLGAMLWSVVLTSLRLVVALLALHV